MQQWPTSKKIDLILIILGVGALFLGFLEIGRTASNFSPRAINWQKIISSKTNQTVTPANLEQIIKLKNTDTDHDGLSDYDEINIYHTNPYLKDTDGDGISDGQEVKDGTNPNCPQGQKCGNFQNANSVKVTKEASTTRQEMSKFFSVNYPTSSNIKSFYQQNVSSSKSFISTAEAARLMSGKANLAEVKQMLLQAGMSPQDLSKIPDEDIMRMYHQMVKNYQQKHFLNNE